MTSTAVEDTIAATSDTEAAAGTEPTTAPMSAEEVALDQANIARRNANRLPYVLTAATAAVGTATWGAAVATADMGVPAVMASGAAGLGCLGVAAVVRHVKREAIADQWRNYYWRVCSAMSGLVSLEGFCGATWGGTGVLSALGATFVAEEILSARWRRAHEISVEPYEVPKLQPFEGVRMLFSRKYVCRADRERQAAEREAEQARKSADVALLGAATVEAFDPIIGEIKRNWACHVKAAGGVLPGAELTGLKRIDETRIRGVIETKPGSMEFEEITRSKVRLAGALFVMRDRISFGKHPDSESKVILTIAVTAVVGEIDEVPWGGPRYDNGRIPLGPTRDGRYAYVDLKGDGGANHLLATGAWRSGKTGTLELIAMSALNSGEWVLMWCDGDPERGSSPLLNRISHVAGAGPEDALRQLEAAEAELKRRGIQKQMTTIDKATGRPVPITDPATQVPADKIVPCREFPGFIWVLDEWKRLVDDEDLQEYEFVNRVEHLLRVGPKYGLCVAVSTHSVLRGDYNGSTTFRGLLAAINYLAFRNPNRREADSIHGVEVRPYELPEGGGYLYSTRSGGLTMARAEHPSDEDRGCWSEVIMQTRATPHPDTELLLAPLRELAPADPVEAMRNAQEEMERWRQSLLAEAESTGEEAANSPQNTKGDKQSPDEQLAAWPGAADMLKETLGRGLTLIQGGADKDLSIGQLKMLAALPGKNAYVAKRAGVSVSYVEKQLPRLVDLGLAVQPEKFGPYKRTPAGDRAVSDAAGELDAEADRELAAKEESELSQLAT